MNRVQGDVLVRYEARNRGDWSAKVGQLVMENDLLKKRVGQSSGPKVSQSRRGCQLMNLARST